MKDKSAHLTIILMAATVLFCAGMAIKLTGNKLLNKAKPIFVTHELDDENTMERFLTTDQE